MTDTVYALQKEYRKLHGWNVDGRWSEKRIQAEIDVKIEYIAAELKRTKAKAEKDAKAEKEREERIALRGDFNGYVKKFRFDPDASTARLVYAVRWAMNVLDAHKEISDKFAQDFASNPVYAMTWADQYFAHAGKYRVAVELRNLFEKGVTVAAIAEYATGTLLRGSQPSKSTSAASNLTDTYVNAAWAKLVTLLSDNDYY